MDLALVCVDNKNNKWISNTGSGILRFDGKNWTNFNSSNTTIDFDHWYPNSLLSDNNGIIYALGDGFGMAVYKDDNWNLYKLPFYSQVIHKDPITNSIYFLSSGNGGNVLIKYNGGDYSDSSSYNFIPFGGKTGFSDFNVYNNKIYASVIGGIGNPVDSNTSGILEMDENGESNYFRYPGWVNTDSAFKWFDELVSTSETNLAMIFTNLRISGPILDRNLYFFNGTKWTTVPLTYGEGISIDPEFLSYAKDGSLWFANNFWQSFRMVKYANNSFTDYSFTVDSYFDQSGIGGIAIDDNNIKWLAAHDSGLLAFKLQ